RIHTLTVQLRCPANHRTHTSTRRPTSLQRMYTPTVQLLCPANHQTHTVFQWLKSTNPALALNTSFSSEILEKRGRKRRENRGGTQLYA
ncbi:hypothetical protein BaRGS_00026596, partial [Batillaria attramentaria]